MESPQEEATPPALPVAGGLAMIVRNSDEAIVGLGVDRRIESWNDGAVRLTGVAEEEILGRDFADLFGVTGSPEARNLLDRVYRGERVASWDTLLRPDGDSEHALSLTLAPARRGARGVQGAFVVLRPARRRHAAERHFQSVLEAMPDAILVTDADGTVSLVNARAESLFGRNRESLIGKTIGELLPDRDRGAFSPAGQVALLSGPLMSGIEEPAIGRDGEPFPAEVSVRSIEMEGDRWVVFAVRDATERQEVEAALRKSQRQLAAANRELRRLASIDGLTGVANRRQLDERLEWEWKRGRRDGRPLSVLMCDIDHFKGYNDALGHLAGDRCLRRVASTLSTCVHRPADLLVRYGGEEFAALLPDTNLAGARMLAERMRQAIADLAIPHPAAPASSSVTLSIGCATAWPTVEGSSPDQLLEEADVALYTAKRTGRNRVSAAGDQPESA